MRDNPFQVVLSARDQLGNPYRECRVLPSPEGPPYVVEAYHPSRGRVDAGACLPCVSEGREGGASLFLLAGMGGFGLRLVVFQGLASSREEADHGGRPEAEGERSEHYHPTGV